MLMSPDSGAPVTVDLLSTVNKYSKQSRLPIHRLRQPQPLGHPIQPPDTCSCLQREKGKNQPGTGRERERERAFDSLAAYSILTFEPDGIQVGLE